MRYRHKSGAIATETVSMQQGKIYAISHLKEGAKLDYPYVPDWMVEDSSDWELTRLRDGWTISAFQVGTSEIAKLDSISNTYIISWNKANRWQGYPADCYLSLSNPSIIKIEQVKRDDGIEFRVGNQVSVLEAKPTIPAPKIVSFYLDEDTIGRIPGMIYVLYAKSGIGVLLDNGNRYDIFDIEPFDENQELLPPLELRPEKPSTRFYLTVDD